MRALLSAIFGLCLMGSAHAGQLIYSSTWVFTGTCNGADQVYAWHVTGTTTPGTWHINSWLPEPIGIIGVELTKISGGPTMWFMIGKTNPEGDPMMYLGPGQNHDRHDFPAGTYWLFPASPTNSDYIDLHGACTGGAQVQIYLTMYYVKNPT